MFLKTRKFQKKTPVLESFFNKVVELKAVTQVFPVKFAKSLRTIFLQNTCDGCFWLPNATIKFCTNATFQQNVVVCSINRLCCKVFHQENFRLDFDFEEVQINVEEVVWLANSNQKFRNKYLKAKNLSKIMRNSTRLGEVHFLPHQTLGFNVIDGICSHNLNQNLISIAEQITQIPMSPWHRYIMNTINDAQQASATRSRSKTTWFFQICNNSRRFEVVDYCLKKKIILDEAGILN